jgi:hypothetical protein
MTGSDDGGNPAEAAAHAAADVADDAADDAADDKETTMAIDTTDIDEQALTLRSQSKGFGKIAEALGLKRAIDANEAFNRALRRRPPEEQATIRAEENRRIDRLASAIKADQSRSQEDVDRRMRAIDRLRARLMAD